MLMAVSNVLSHNMENSQRNKNSPEVLRSSIGSERQKYYVDSYNLDQSRESGKTAIIYNYSMKTNAQTHILFLKTDSFHIVNPPEHR